jgi:hypothetical protein
MWTFSVKYSVSRTNQIPGHCNGAQWKQTRTVKSYSLPSNNRLCVNRRGQIRKQGARSQHKLLSDKFDSDEELLQSGEVMASLMFSRTDRILKRSSRTKFYIVWRPFVSNGWVTALLSSLRVSWPARFVNIIWKEARPQLNTFRVSWDKTIADFKLKMDMMTSVRLTQYSQRCPKLSLKPQLRKWRFTKVTECLS